VFGAREAWIAGVLAATSGILVDRGATVDPAALYAGWLAFLAAASIVAVRDGRWAPVVGLLWALMALTRGEGLYVGLAAPLWLLTRRSWRAAGVCAACFALAMLPYWSANAALHGNPFFSVHSYHLRVHRFAEAMWDGYGRTFPSAAAFLCKNWASVLRSVARNAYRYATALLRPDWAGVGLLIAGLAWVLRRWTWPREAWVVVVVGVFQWLAVSGMWSTTGGMPEPEHLASPLTVLIVPVAAFGVVALARGRVWTIAALMGLIAASYLPGLIRFGHETPAVLRDAAGYQRAAWAAAAYLGPDDVVASCRPWPVWWLLRRPVIFLPRGLSRELQLSFLDEYDVRAIVDWRNQVEPWIGLPGMREVFRDPSNDVTVLLRGR
ncbi:MAG: glycosyltransferase family 39 protein, partial [Armatimonadetes bacterium]|nr:glycosyltransferase family 39 protein [Armatimonadota bacterium]